jgi:hypothetical protein
MKTPINTIEQRIAEELSYRIEGTQGRFYFDMYVDGREVEIEGWCDYRDHIEKGIDSGSWGLVEDIEDTKAYFGTAEEIALMGRWAYIYVEKDDILSLQLEKIEPTKVLHVEGCELFLYRLDLE